MAGAKAERDRGHETRRGREEAFGGALCVCESDAVLQE